MPAGRVRLEQQRERSTPQRPRCYAATAGWGRHARERIVGSWRWARDGGSTAPDVGAAAAPPPDPAPRNRRFPPVMTATWRQPGLPTRVRGDHVRVGRTGQDTTDIDVHDSHVDGVP